MHLHLKCCIDCRHFSACFQHLKVVDCCLRSWQKMSELCVGSGSKKRVALAVTPEMKKCKTLAKTPSDVWCDFCMCSVCIMMWNIKCKVAYLMYSFEGKPRSGNLIEQSKYGCQSNHARWRWVPLLLLFTHSDVKHIWCHTSYLMHWM